MKKTTRLLALLCLATPASAQDWSGFYAGGALGYDSITANDLGYGDGPVDLNGAGFGLFAGYNIQSGSLVYGVELAAIKHSGEGDDGDYLRPASALHSLALRGRIGFVTGKMLPYLALGTTRTTWEADHSGNDNPGDLWEDTAKGTSVALGLDWSLGDKSFLRIEVERTRYGEDQMGFYNGADPHGYELDATRVSLGYAMRF